MNERIKNLLPNDCYSIQLQTPCHEDYVMALTHLYQPLIGLQAVSIYLTLLNEAKMNQNYTTHHHIMNIVNIDLDEFYEARIKLEAIGLLKTYVEDKDVRTYHYVLIPPFSTTLFFEDSMLSILLAHHIGQKQYDNLKQKLCSTTLPNQAFDQTKSFKDVFSTLQTPTIFPQEKDKEMEPNGASESSFDEEALIVDFEWLEQSMRKNNIDIDKVLTKENKSFINNLAKIYHVDMIYLEKAFLWSVNENMDLVKDELHEACKDYYAKTFHTEKPELQLKINHTKERNQEQKQSPQSKEGKLIQHFENITHREILEDFSRTGVASEQEVKMITNAMFKHGLPQSVMNVLVHYVLQKSDMKLTRNYIEKIATHWARKNVKTAKQAMQLAKSEANLYQSWGNKKKTSYKKKEVLPEWFKKEENSEQPKTKKQAKSDQEIEKEKQELQKALNNMTTKSFNR
ncbi:replicative DNA helicase loader DnaB [Salinibacillus kushneri]|uniref:Replicative DNA helicase loader DnaB n=1 Tax=Salinibacillus kushneri TaxID=237682 RepID=A0A1I0H5I5_9BACI|nr:DnaD domain protein [Salinibacillus kushneri]SET78884.1 replicative DNA helicase loader DnaB [Salinibacillus kushneri]